MSVLDPEYLPAGRPYGRGETVHVRNDFPCRRAQRVGDAVHHEAILQVYYDQGGLGRVEGGEGVRGSSARDHRVDNSLRDGNFMHRDTLFKMAPLGRDGTGVGDGRCRIDFEATGQTVIAEHDLGGELFQAMTVREGAARTKTTAGR